MIDEDEEDEEDEGLELCAVPTSRFASTNDGEYHERWFLAFAGIQSLDSRLLTNQHAQEPTCRRWILLRVQPNAPQKCAGRPIGARSRTCRVEGDRGPQCRWQDGAAEVGR